MRYNPQDQLDVLVRRLEEFSSMTGEGVTLSRHAAEAIRKLREELQAARLDYDRRVDTLAKRAAEAEAKYSALLIKEAGK